MQHLFIEYQHCANQYAKCHSVSLVNFLHVDMTNLKYLCLAFTIIPESIQLKTCPVSRGSVSLYFMKEMREKRSFSMEISHSLGCERKIFVSYPRTFFPLPSDSGEFAFSFSSTGSHPPPISTFASLLFM